MNLTVSPKQFEQTIKELGHFVSIPSVSNPNSSDYSMENLDNAASFTVTRLKTLGFNITTRRIEKSPMFVMAQLIVDISKPTLLFYAHYDVQPVEREKWLTGPFNLFETQGRLYGRGSSDDKGGIMAILTALRVIKEANQEFPVNLKILFEGEEEYGSAHMKELLKQHHKDLKADALIVMDGGNIGVDTGTLTSSTKGLVNLKLTVEALEKPVHSGIGCLVPDPAQSLAKLITSLEDPKAIKGFMDDCELLSQEERDLLTKSSQTSESYRKENGVKEGTQLRGNEEEAIYVRILNEPSISIVNMNCGQPDGGNSIQDKASCQIGIRLIPGQNPDRIAKVVMDHLKSQKVLWNLPISVTYPESGSYAWKANLEGKFSQKYLQAMRNYFPKTGAMPCGGALPLMHEFQEQFPEMEMLIAAVEDPECSAHSHNESQDKKLLENQINSLISFIYLSGKV